MAGFVKGDVVVVPFPFSDLAQAKRRPALVLAELDGDDRILCQITSRPLQDKYAIALGDEDFVEGGSKQDSHIRPNRIFTSEKPIILYRAGHLNTGKIQEVIERVVAILQGS